MAKPSLGLPGWVRKQARWCKSCPNKPPEAINVSKRRCECGASSYPVFDLPFESPHTAKWCAKCPGRPLASINLRYVPMAQRTPKEQE